MHIALESELTLLLAGVAPAVTRAEWRRCRNAIVLALARFGSVGPTGVQNENDEETASFGRRDLSFHVVDDMYNDSQRLHLIETDASRVNEELLIEISQALTSHPLWTAFLGIRDSGLYVLADRIVPCGRRFWDCDSVHAVAERCSRAVDFGPAPAPWPQSYGIWRDLVCGTWHRDQLPSPPDRQWAYIFGYLSETKRISQFTYRNRVAHDLHPTTRRELISHFLVRFGDGSETSTIGVETAAGDMGSLLNRFDDAINDELLSQLKTAQAKLEPKEAFYLWTMVVYGANVSGISRAAVSNRLASFLLAGTLPPHPEIHKLSAVLGLASLRHPEVSARAAYLSQQNPHWGPAIHEWLQKLSSDPGAYPYPLKEIEFSTLHKEVR